VDRVKVTVDYVDAGRQLRKLFLTHDWGALFGYLLVIYTPYWKDEKYPRYIDDMIALDVGGIGFRDRRPIPWLMASSY
jgi:hypothetical protein